MKTKIVRIPVLGDHLVNTYLLVGRRPILADCGMPSSGDRIWDGITAAGVDPTDLEIIIVTHGHVDHFGAAAELEPRTGAPVAAHSGDLTTYSLGTPTVPGASRSVPSDMSSPGLRPRMR